MKIKYIILLILLIGSIIFLSRNEFVLTRVNINKGISMLEREKYKDARKIFDKVLTIAADNFKARYYSAICYEKLEQYDKALSELIFAVNINPENLDTLWHLMMLNTRITFNESANNYARTAAQIKLKKTDKQIEEKKRIINFAQALVYYYQKDWSRSASFAAKYAAEYPDFIIANRLLGINYFKMGLYDQAEKSIDNVISKKEKDPLAYVYKALIKVKKNNWNLAYYYLDEALSGNEKYKPQFIDIFLKELDEMPVSEEEFSSFSNDIFVRRESLENIIKYDIPTTATQQKPQFAFQDNNTKGRIDVKKLNLVYSQIYCGKYKEALALLDQEIAKRGGSLSGLHYTKARIFEKMKDNANAKIEYLKEIKIAPHKKTLFRLSQIIDPKKDELMLKDIENKFNEQIYKKINAPEMKSDVGEHDKNKIVLKKKGYVEGILDFGKDDAKQNIGFIAEGTKPIGVNPLIEIVINDCSIAKIYLSESNNSYYEITIPKFKDKNKVKLNYINSYWNPKNKDVRKSFIQAIFITKR